MAILIISNPISGDGRGSQFIAENVVPLLDNSGHSYQLEETKEAGAAGRLALEFLLNHEHDHESNAILVSGGDGTIHDLVNGLGVPSSLVRLVICPQGTANALYSTLFPPSKNEESSLEYRLQSLRAFLDGRSRSLTLTQTQLLTSDGQVTETILGVVVVSSALHASILDSAEHLRTKIPSIDRFKVAAMENISNWYQSHVKLLQPSQPSGPVRIYDPELGAFIPLETPGQTYVELPGPYEYFLSTVNVDRLEPAFETSPLFVKLPPVPGEMDLIIVRPLRDPSLESDNSESRTAFVQKSSAMLQGVYNGGAHISQRYTEDGIVVSEGDGSLVVEYYRAGGWEWVPAQSDPGSHLICVDGTVLNIPQGGKATCLVVSNTPNARFVVCA